MIDGDFVAISVGELGIGKMVAEVGVGGGVGNFVRSDGLGIGGGVVRITVGGFVLGCRVID